MAKESKKSAAGLYEMVSFRLAAEHFRTLQAYADTQRDPESGTPLTASLAARKLLVEALRSLPKKKV